MIDLVAFGLILDDLAFPDGRTVPGVLGGGGPQAAFGMRLWAEGVGLVSGVGRDLPDEALAWFAASDIDTAGLRFGPGPTPRARQEIDANGGRRHTWLTPPEEAGPQLQRSLDRLPETYRQARGFHHGLHPKEADLDFALELRRMGAVVSLETFRPAAQPLAPEALHALVSAPHVFSATLQEAQSLVGPGRPRSVARRLIEHGAWIVALRLGAEGSLVIEGQTGRGALIPAVPVPAVNPVGAGNAYCGGFLAGWIETRDVVAAGLCGTVAASFVIEQIGLPVVDDGLRTEAQRRRDALRAQVQPVAV
jgi:sugar/nucleoside kinase (ribokinase family)